MRMKRILALALAILMVVGVLAACGKAADTGDNASSSAASSSSSADQSSLKGEITFIHHRTDLDKNVIQEYIKKFNEKYPNITVKTETMSDYEGEMRLRLNSGDYGDVLIVTDQLNKADIPNYYEKLGTVSDFDSKYNWMKIAKTTIGSDVYGIPIGGNASGIVYNKRIWAEAGITTPPTTTDEFVNDLKLIKEKTKAIPFYTNYAADWPLAGQYEDNRTAISGDADYVNKLAHMDDPFAPGKPHYIIYKILYDAVKNKLSEADPLTTDWESSKTKLATGEIATMVLGSWAINQCRERATQNKTNPEDVSFMPFPTKAPDGKLYSTTGPDKYIGISKNSKNKELARLWLDFFVDETGFALSQGQISTLKSDPFPDNLKSFTEMGVTLITNDPPEVGKETLVDDIDKKSEVGLWQSNFKKEIVEAALGTKKESYDDIMNNLNKKWAKVRKDMGVNP